MYIKMNNDKSLVITVPTTIYQGETNADLITFLIPSEYEGYNVADCTIEMDYVLPTGSDCSDKLVYLPEMYKSYLQYSTPIDTRFTSNSGTLAIWLTGYDVNRNIIFKTGEVLIPIKPKRITSNSDPSNDSNCNCDDKDNILTAGAEDALDVLAECGILIPAYQDGVFYTSTDGNIYTL